MRQDIQVYNMEAAMQCQSHLTNGLQELGYYGIEQKALQGNLQNCAGLQGIQPYYNYCQCHSGVSLGDFELSITQHSKDSQPLLNYGPKLRLIIADPIKGIDLREAIAKLRTALKEASDLCHSK